jgi:hypothetical protein
MICHTCSTYRSTNHTHGLEVCIMFHRTFMQGRTVLEDTVQGCPTGYVCMLHPEFAGQHPASWASTFRQTCSTDSSSATWTETVDTFIYDTTRMYRMYTMYKLTPYAQEGEERNQPPTLQGVQQPARAAHTDATPFAPLLHLLHHLPAGHPCLQRIELGCKPTK